MEQAGPQFILENNKEAVAQAQCARHGSSVLSRFTRWNTGNRSPRLGGDTWEPLCGHRNTGAERIPNSDARVTNPRCIVGPSRMLRARGRYLHCVAPRGLGGDGRCMTDNEPRRLESHASRKHRLSAVGLRRGGRPPTPLTSKQTWATLGHFIDTEAEVSLYWNEIGGSR